MSSHAENPGDICDTPELRGQVASTGRTEGRKERGVRILIFTGAGEEGECVRLFLPVLVFVFGCGRTTGFALRSGGGENRGRRAAQHHA